MKKEMVPVIIIFWLFAIALSGCFESETQEEGGIEILSDGMSHGDSPQQGIIDKGDIVFYSEITNKSEIITWIQGKPIDYKKYGNYGDVILFKAMNDINTQIVHRAICWVEYHEEFGTCTIEDYEITNVSNITIAELGLNVYEPNNSGFITKGDNNSICDQESGVCIEPVKLEWIIGKIVKLEDK